MKKITFFIFILVVILYNYGCVRTDIITQKDSNFYSKNKKIHRMMLLVNSSDMETRVELEEKYSNLLTTEYKIKTIPSSSIFLFSVSYNPEKILDKIKKNNIDCVLTLSMVESWVSEHNLPSSSTTSGTVSPTPWGSYIYSEKSTTYPSGTIKKPRGIFQAMLCDAVTPDVYWVAQVKARGSAFNSWRDLYDEALEDIIEKMEDENIILHK